METVQVGNYPVRVTLVANVSLALVTGKWIVLQRPDGTSFEKAATFTTDGSDGSIYIDTATGELNVSGTWRAQQRVTGSGSALTSSVVSFNVAGNL